MFENNYISTIVENQLPEFVRADHPQFVLFLKKYYEYMEQSGKTLEVGKNLYNYMDVDQTRADLLTYFKNNIIPDFPEQSQLSQEKILKAARSFYQKKGTGDSFKFLFRVLYGQEVEVYFPKQDILKASDGKWIQPNVVRFSFADSANLVSTTANNNGKLVYSNSSYNLISGGVSAGSYIRLGTENRQVVSVNAKGDYLTTDVGFVTAQSLNQNLYIITKNQYANLDWSLLKNREGYGDTSRTTCVVETITKYIDAVLNTEIVQFYVSNVTRNFVTGEYLVVPYSDANGNPQTFTAKIVSYVQDVTLLSPGSTYLVGDPVVISGGLSSDPDATPAQAIVSEVTQGSLGGLQLVDAGYFYDVFLLQRNKVFINIFKW
jgi:hypothetical protein